MAPLRIVSGFLLVLAIAVPAVAQESAETAPPDPQPVGDEAGESATGVELFDFTEGEAGATGEILEASARAERAAEAGLLRVGDLAGRPVLGVGDEIIGEIGRVVRWDGKVWAVLETGGVAGIGDDEVPVEVRHLSVGPDLELHLPGVDEEALEEASDMDLEGAEDIEPDVPLTTPAK